MARRQITNMAAWPSLSLEGNLIAPAMVAKIDRREAEAQDERDYGVRKGLTVRQEIALAFRVGQAHFDAFARIEAPSMETTRCFMRGFLAEVLGFDDLAVVTSGTVTWIAGGIAPVVVVPRSESLDRRRLTLSTDRVRSPALALQDYLNEHDEALWGLATNGATLRLMRDNASLTRPAHIEADLAQIFDTEDAASFAALWLIVHRSRFGAEGAAAADCALERWRDTGAREGEAVRDRLAGQVEIALRVLGTGFLRANPGLVAQLRSGDLPLTDWFNELLRLLYRLIFLMVAEDRDLLHPTKARQEARQLYSDGYSLAALRARCRRRASWGHHHDRYEGMKIVFRALADGEDALALPALGGLFEAGQLSRLASARLPNDAFMKAVYHLSWLVDKDGLVPVNWRAMETEELGSVYEALLELQPQLADDGRELAFASHTSEQKGNQRKTTGSYYTPDSLVQTLLDTTLDPVLDRAEAETEDPASALLKLTVIDPACGSGHFLLAAARRIATRLARIRADDTPTLADFRHALRDVARCCIHGVDRNPMAVELAKVALWIETVDPGLPLGFFDAQIRCGDSLIGVFDYEMLRAGLPDAAFDPLTGDDKEIAKDYKAINKQQRDGAGASGLIREIGAPSIADGAAKLLAMPEDTLQEIEAKSRAWGRLLRDPKRLALKAACDMYVAAFLLPKTGVKPDPRRTEDHAVPTTEAIWDTIRGGDVRSGMADACTEAVETNRVFHWPLEFPAVMARGGFDVVIGNPPWERIKLQEREFFAARDPEIASAANKAERNRLIKALKQAEAGTPKARLSEEFETAKHTSEAASVFVRKSGRFPLAGTGDVNTYALFAEHFACLARGLRKGDPARNGRVANSNAGDGRSPPAGRAGVIVPTGIATDDSTSAFFGDLVARSRLSALYDFENREGLFPGVHRQYRFSILAIGPSRRGCATRFAAYLRNIKDLGEKERRIELEAKDFKLMNPNTRTAPLFRARADLDLTRGLYEAAPVLIRDQEDQAVGDNNPWGITFQTLFHMSNDSGHFRTAAQLGGQGFSRDGSNWRHPDGRVYVPLYEAKMVHHFDHRFGSFAGLNRRPGDGSLPETPDCVKADPNHEPDPWYWAPEDETALRVARMPSRLKQYYRKGNVKGCLKVLAEWVLGTLDPAELEPGRQARAVPAVEARLREVLGQRVLARGVVGARLQTWLGRVADAAVRMQRDTPLNDDDIAFIRYGPSDPLELVKALIDHKQPRWLMGWRDITNATNERTVVASVFPRVGVGHTLPIMFPAEVDGLFPVLVAQLSSLTLDYVSRQKLAGTHLTYFYLQQLPVLTPKAFGKADIAYIKNRVLELTYTSYSMRPWAEALGYTGEPFAFDPDRRAQLRADLDAFFAQKYGVCRDELRYILDPADTHGSAYPSETFRGLKRNEMERYGEYRTGQLVLAAWDRLEAGGEFGELGL